MVQFRDKMENKSYKLHKLLAYFSVLRNLIWLGAMTLVTSEFHNTIKENRYHRSFSIGFQFFALFSVYGTVKLVQGFNYETPNRMIYFLLDTFISLIFNLVTMSYGAYQLMAEQNSTDKNNWNMVVISVLVVNLFLLILNILSFNMVFKVYKVFKQGDCNRKMNNILETSRQYRATIPPVQNNYTTGLNEKTHDDGSAENLKYESLKKSMTIGKKVHYDYPPKAVRSFVPNIYNDMHASSENKAIPMPPEEIYTEAPDNIYDNLQPAVNASKRSPYDNLKSE